jgi:serine/threonine protein kinase
MTTDWVLTGESPHFPILHHWRVLPAGPRPVNTTQIDELTAHWDGSPAVRERLLAIATATASLVLCTEFIPQTLHRWLTAGGPERVQQAGERMLAVAGFLRAHDFVHFDAHPGNVLTDGDQVYLADFGLALSAAFELSGEETAFLARHRDWDRHDIPRYLVNGLHRRLAPDADRAAFIQDCLAGNPPDGMPPEAVAVIARHGETTLLLNTFYDRLFTELKASVSAAGSGSGAVRRASTSS